MSGKLFVVGTPIGNLGDISKRAVETLNNVDFIAAEDTRVTRKLLSYLNIKKPMISYFEHNKYEKGQIICDKILSGENCALVTDAGMPAISDPGEILVRQCHELKIEVNVVPGPSALIAALAMSGMPTGRFTFEGFLSTSKKSRLEHLNELKHEKRTIIFYEAPHKLLRTLTDIHEYLGNRDIAIVREITKIHEEIKFFKVSDAIQNYKDGVKGEIVLIIKGYESTKQETYTLDDAVKIAIDLVNKGSSKSEASKEAAQISGIKKSDIYREVIKTTD